MKIKLAQGKDENKKRNKSESLKDDDPHRLLSIIANDTRIAIHKFRMDPNGKMSMPYSSPAIFDIYGMTPEEIYEDFDRAFQLICPDDHENLFAAIEKSKRTMQPLYCEWRVNNPDKGEVWVDCRSKPEMKSDGTITWNGYLQDITELKKAEQLHQSHLRFFTNMDQINRAIQGAENLEQMMSDVLDSILFIFNCDRAWLCYPCDPDAEFWRVPMERTKPEYPGAFAANVEVPFYPDVVRTMNLLLDSTEPMTFGSGSQYSIDENMVKEFDIQSMIAMAIYPKVGKPWMFGLHQCSNPRVWTEDEKELLGEIGRRMSDSLTSLLVSRDLQQSEERFRQAFEFAGVGVGMLGLDDQWIRVNRSFCDMMGYSAEELQGMTCSSLTHPEDICHCQNSEQRLLSDDIPCTQIENRYRHKQGHYLWVRMTNSVVQNDNNEPLYFIVQIENIDQLKQDEAEISLLSFALNHVKEASYLIDESARFHYVNDEVCHRLGYNRDELLCMSVPDVDPGCSMEFWREHWREIIDKGSVTLDSEHQTKTGEIFPVEIYANYFEYDGHGYNLALVRDITERKKTEQDIALLNFAISHINEGVYLLNEDGGFEYANEKACQSFGYSREELLKLSVADIHENFQISLWRQHWQDITQRHHVILETVHKTKKGILYPVEVNANYFEYGGRSYNLVLEHDLSERKRVAEALQQSEAELQIALDAGQLGDWQWDLAKNELVWSARCKAIFGLPPDAEMSPEIFQNLVHPDDRAEVSKIMDETVETGKDYETVKRHTMPDGTIRWTIGRGRLIYNENGEPTVMAGITMDITERVLAEQAQHEAEYALLESDERFRQMAESVEEVFWLTDVSKKKMLYVSPAYETIWGGACEDLYADPLQWFEAVHPDDKPGVWDEVIKSQTTGNFNIEYRIIRPDGTERMIHDRAFPIYDSSGKLYRISGVAQDITIRKEQDARIQYLAYHDALTSLPNRVLVMNRLEQAIAHAQRQNKMLAVLFVDLDHFKTINDTLGHLAGDTLLQKAGVCLVDILREEDTIGRVGGDEFLILLPGLDRPQDAAHVTEKIIESLSVPFKVAGHELHVNASVGISLYPRDAKESETLVKYADTALYLAKEQGRNTFRFFSPELDARVRARLHMENDLRYAIERNELFLHYQPQIEQSSGKFIGAEALLRWQHPIHGLVSPAEFIPIAEETGLIVPIGEWVLREASSQARKWKSLGSSDFQVSINLSRRQLEQKDFAKTVHQILEESRCDPNLIELEITESSAMNEPEEAIIKLQALHDMGIQLAIDDFGTGYSSLTYLKRFPFDRLKIDQSFVSGIPDDADDIAIIQITIMLAHQLRLKVIAEGVETERQREFLQENGCEEMQGYLFGKPMSPVELEKIISS